MKLLTLEEIKNGLDKEFIPLEPMLSGYRLIDGGLTEKQISQCETTLSISFPRNLREILSTYDFGNLTIGPIAFCATGDYPSELIEYNGNLEWWGEGQRPNNLIMIANSDPFVILLDISRESVIAVDPELGLKNASVVADGIENFLRGVGTIILFRNESDNKGQLAQSVHDIVGGKDFKFWAYLAK
jgi:hypothetical protein